MPRVTGPAGDERVTTPDRSLGATGDSGASGRIRARGRFAASVFVVPV